MKSRIRRASIFLLIRSQTTRCFTSNNLYSGYHPCKFGPCRQTADANLNLNINFATTFSATQRRWASGSVVEEDNKISIGPHKGRAVEENEKDTAIVYYGPISSTIKKGAVASSVVFLSASTTAALHWFVSPYIHKLRWQSGSDTFDVEMLSWLASHVPKTIKFAGIRLPETNRPFVTFKANENFYFVDAEHCHNKALLTRLTPQKGTEESAFKNL